VGPGLRLQALHKPHGSRIDHVDHPRLADSFKRTDRLRLHDAGSKMASNLHGGYASNISLIRGCLGKCQCEPGGSRQGAQDRYPTTFSISYDSVELQARVARCRRCSGCISDSADAGETFDE
jgi:hypothetical protein